GSGSLRQDRRMLPSRIVVAFALLTTFAGHGGAQTPPPAVPAAPAPPLPTQRPPTRADILRGEYGRYRANNDLLYYHLDVRGDPVKKTVGGKNTVRCKMLKDDNPIQLELYANLNVDKITMGPDTLKYTRDLNTVYIDFPKTLKAD